MTQVATTPISIQEDRVTAPTSTDPAPLRRIHRTDHLRHGRLANHLADGANRGFLELPPAIGDAVRLVATLELAGEVVASEAGRLGSIVATAEGAAVSGALAAAAAGQDPGPIEAPIAEAEAMLARVRRRADLLTRALSAAEGMLAETMGQETAHVWDALEAALAETLAAAASDAPTVLDGVHDWSDPMAVHRAPEPAQAAFGRLVPLTARHDHVRAAAALAYSLAELPEWQTPDAARIRGFEGGGIAFTYFGGFGEDGSPATDRIQSVDYRPAGHPVQRLAIAAVTPPAPMPAAEPAPAIPAPEPRRRRRYRADGTPDPWG